MTGSFNIGKLSITGVLRHRFEKEKYPMENYSMWKDWRLGLWFNKYKAVGKKDFQNPSKWSSNTVNCYMIGIDLVILKMWVTIDFGSMKLEI